MQTIMIRFTGMVLATLLLVPSMVAQQSQSTNRNGLVALQNQMPEKDSEAYARLNQVIKLNLQNASVEEALKVIARKADLKLMYGNALLPREKKVNYANTWMSVMDALWDVLDGTGIQYAISDNSQLVLLAMRGVEIDKVQEVQETVTGRVTDSSSGETLPGVNIIVKGTDTGTSTNLEGEYQLNVPSLSDTLVFSFVGYETREVPINNRNQIDIELTPSAVLGAELIVVGYGTQRRDDITGSVSIADMESLDRVSTQSVANALKGQIAGVRVQTSGAPGEEPAINIRGVGSFGSNDPLYIVDGIQVDNIIDFDVSQFESVQVLKDAAASAVYGSRAANGVIIIETEKGREGDLQISYRGTYGTENIHKRIDMLEREEFQTLQNEMLRNTGVPLSAASANDPDSPDFIDDINTDWQEEAYDRGFSTKQNLTISGGNQTSTYSIGGSYEINGGTFNGPAPSYEAVNARVNSTHKLGRFTIGENITLTKSFRDPQTSILNNGLSLVHETIQGLPIIPVKDPDRLGGFGGPRAGIEQGIALNTIAVNQLMEREQVTNRALVNLWGEVSILENLTYKLNLAYDSRNFVDEWFQPSFDLGFFFNEPEAELQITENEIVNTTIENIINYSTNYKSHNIDILGGYTEEQRRLDNRFTAGTGFGERPFFKVLNAAENRRASGFKSKSTLRSLFTRLEYDFDNRYLLTTTFRRDGSSRFGENNKWGNFPSISAGWRISSESFFNIGWIDDLKIRGSWGKLGNQEIADFATIPVINNFANFNFNDGVATGANQVSLVNEDLKWEVLTSKTIGLDARFLNNRLEFTFDYFDNESKDILVGVPLPGSIGSAANPIANAATVDNSGIEITAGYRDTFGELSFGINTNIATLNNEVQSLGLGEPIFGAASITDVGTEIGELFGFVTDGIFQNQAEVDAHAFQEPGTSVGDIRFVDINGDGVVNQDDRTTLGSPTPDFTYGVTLDFGFRNFDASLFFQGNYGNKIFNHTRRVVEGMSDFNNNSVRVFENRWTPENMHNDVRFPRAARADPNGNNRDSDRFIESGSYLRLQNLTIGYTIPSIGNLGVQNVRVFVGAQNLFTITGYTGLDPELGTGGGVSDGSNAVTNIVNDGLFSRGFDDGAWPHPRRFELGVEILF